MRGNNGIKINNNNIINIRRKNTHETGAGRGSILVLKVKSKAIPVTGCECP
jgi:hypothetical protein